MAPHAEVPPLQPADVAACRATLAANSRSFHAASLLLPRRVRDPASVLYGFCRLADDAVDVDGGQAAAVQRLRQRIDRVYAGHPDPVPADRALAAVVARHGIPRELPLLLLEGLAWDTQGRVYETLADLHDYAARVAGTVGAMMCLLMGVREPAALARATDLGVAMQLSNIARDVGEDARMGRLYLPRQWLREAGLQPEAWLAAPRFDAALAQVVQRLLAQARALYAQAGAGVGQLPLACRPGINAARWLYAAIGDEVARAGGDSVTRRASVPGHRQALMLLAAWCCPCPDARALQAPVLPANRPLLEAVAAWPVQPLPADDGAVGVVVDLFQRLAQRDRLHRTSA
jgi:15-cis-phytoene synthase